MHLRVVLTAILAGALPASAQLNKLANEAGLLYFGTAVDNPGLNNQAYMAIARDTNEFGQVTPANGQKWDSTERSQGQFSYGNGDAVTSVARQAGQLLRCHTLVWHSQLPSWVSNVYSRDQMESVIRTHIENVAGHYKGQCYAWDVVNEALEDNGSFRQSPMYTAMGADFIPFSFKVAAEVDPAAKLYYNDYNIEYPGAKASAALEIVKTIQAAGARIDGVGGQAHFIVGKTPSKQDLMGVLSGYAALVDEVTYTEIDIRHESVPASASNREQQARDYVSVVDACLQTPKCVGITVWDFADQYSWVPSTFSGQGEACLWDNNLNKKPAYTSLVSLFQSAASSRSAASSVIATPNNLTSTASPTPNNTTSIPVILPGSTISTAITLSQPSSANVTNSGGPVIFTPPASAEDETTSEEVEVVVVTEFYTETVIATEIDTVVSTITQFTDPPAPTPPAGGGVSRYGQCGGSGYSGPTVCVAGATCSAVNDYYYQCL